MRPEANHPYDGCETRDVTSFSLALPGQRYESEEQRAGFLEQLLARLAAAPEVASVGASTNLPLTGSSMTFGYRPVEAGTEGPQEFGQFHATTPGYFEAIGLRLLAGRSFDSTDRPDGRPVVIVNETLARRHWPDGQALGRQLSVVSRGGPVVREIAGVALLLPAVALLATWWPARRAAAVSVTEALRSG